MIPDLVIASWFAFLVSGAVIIIGGVEELRNHEDKGIFIVYAGFIGLALSGLMM
ncbi:hypothetical protein LCGC14_2978590, partial [marine sediment metagenome]